MNVTDFGWAAVISFANDPRKQLAGEQVPWIAPLKRDADK